MGVSPTTSIAEKTYIINCTHQEHDQDDEENRENEEKENNARRFLVAHLESTPNVFNDEITSILRWESSI
jgi:hypothetical protein